VAVALTAAAACGPTERNLELREQTQHYAFRITVTPTPPVAELGSVYKIIVQDKETGEPIQAGEGRLFASNIDQTNIYDGLAKGKEVGTYYARLRFPAAGEWAMGLQFRRDSLHPLERSGDWRQGVLTAPPLGSGIRPPQ